MRLNPLSRSSARRNSTSSPPPRPPPTSNDEQQQRLSYMYTVRPPWQWVMTSVFSSFDSDIREVSSPSELLSASLQANATVTATPNIARRRSVLKKGPTPCTLRLELVENKQLIKALHATSAALDGLEDKDELVRTMQRCRCEHLEISPPSILIKWDVLREELSNYVPSLPTLDANHKIAVLKEPMGSSGEGIYFISSHDEAFEHMERHRKQALEQPELLDSILNQKGRMPAWVLQAEVYPPMLLESKKFHIRSNICLVETLWKEELVEIYIHNRHEVRIASQPIQNGNSRDALAHITNGANDETTSIALLHDIPQLAPLQQELEVFLAKAFQAFMPDIIRRVGYSASQSYAKEIQKFCIAGVDIMMTSSGRFYLLEVNVNPTAPSPDKCHEEFKQHLCEWMHDVVKLILNEGNNNNFVNINNISPLATT